VLRGEGGLAQLDGAPGSGFGAAPSSKSALPWRIGERGAVLMEEAAVGCPAWSPHYGGKWKGELKGGDKGASAPKSMTLR
jgi:hypothetical protein